MTIQENSTAEKEMTKMVVARRVSETATWNKTTAKIATYRTEDKSLVLLQVKCKRV
jgi:hypothetical protein